MYKRQVKEAASQVKPEVPEGLLKRCNKCGKGIFTEDYKKNLYICPKCGGYLRMPAQKRIAFLTEKDSFEEWETGLTTEDPLHMIGYPDRIKSLQEKTKLDEAVDVYKRQAMSEADFDNVIDTNLKGCFQMIRFASRRMMKQRYGRIINVSSVSGVAGNAGQANYSASKAGIIGLTKSAAKELASRGITCNAIAPGFVKTEMTDVLPDEVKENAKKQIPLGRFAEPEDIANAAVFLASDKASYLSLIHI